MHETPDELTALQRLLDESYEAAGEHLRSIITPERRLTAEQVSAELQGMVLLALATVTADGAPLVGPVDGHFLHGKFWFGSAANSVRFKHIRARPQVSATHFRGEELVVTVHGSAVEIDVSTGEYDFLQEHFREVYPDFDNWGFWGDAPYAYIEARRVYAGSFSDIQK
jgi:uncharacterized pyridoxamine 5'-phosphate oxidase family protein